MYLKCLYPFILPDRTCIAGQSKITKKSIQALGMSKLKQLFLLKHVVLIKTINKQKVLGSIGEFIRFVDLKLTTIKK